MYTLCRHFGKEGEARDRAIDDHKLNCVHSTFILLHTILRFLFPSLVCSAYLYEWWWMIRNPTQQHPKWSSQKKNEKKLIKLFRTNISILFVAIYFSHLATRLLSFDFLLAFLKNLLNHAQIFKKTCISRNVNFPNFSSSFFSGIWAYMHCKMLDYLIQMRWYFIIMKISAKTHCICQMSSDECVHVVRVYLR